MIEISVTSIWPKRNLNLLSWMRDLFLSWTLISENVEKLIALIRKRFRLHNLYVRVWYWSVEISRSYTFSSLKLSISLLISDWSCDSFLWFSICCSSRRWLASFNSVSKRTFSSWRFRSSFRSDINWTVSWFSWSSKSCFALSNRSAVRRFPASSACNVAILKSNKIRFFVKRSNIDYRI